MCRYISDCGKGRKVSDLLARFTLADMVRSPHPPVTEVGFKVPSVLIALNMFCYKFGSAYYTDPRLWPFKKKKKFKKILIDTNKWSQKQPKKIYLARLQQNLSFKLG